MSISTPTREAVAESGMCEEEINISCDQKALVPSRLPSISHLSLSLNFRLLPDAVTMPKTKSAKKTAPVKRHLPEKALPVTLLSGFLV